MLLPHFLNRNSSIFDTNLAQKFIVKYAGEDNWHEIDIAMGNLGYGWIHYAKIRAFRPKRVLCIGSRQGFIPAICALACKDNNFGVVDFVDAGYDQAKDEPHHFGGIGLWRRVQKDIYFKPFGLNTYINLYVMTSAQFAKHYSARTYGYIHVDGDHSYVGVKRDYQLFYQRLIAGGYMGFHDISTQDLGGLEYGVAKFWRELCKKHALKLEYTGKCGLGMIQKQYEK